MSEKRYECAACHGVFEPAWSEEEAAAESAELWGVDDPAHDPDMAVVCDTCWREMMGLPPKIDEVQA